MRPSTSFYTEREALKFIDQNQNLVGMEVFTNERKTKKAVIEALTYSRKSTGTNIYLYNIICSFKGGTEVPLFELVNLNNGDIIGAIKING